MRKNHLCMGDHAACQPSVGWWEQVMLGEAAVPYEKIMMQLDSKTGEYHNMGAQTLGHKGPSLDYRKIQNLDHDPIFMAYMRRAPSPATVATRRLRTDGCWWLWQGQVWLPPVCWCKMA